MHVNVKPLDRHQTYETAEEAISHVIDNRLYARHWQNTHFGRDLKDIRRVADAIGAKDTNAFRR